MTLLFQVAGVLAAAAVLVALARQFLPTGGGAVPIVAALPVVAAVPVVLGAVVALPNLQVATKGFYEQRKDNRRIPAREAAVRGGVVGGVDVDFLEWVRRRLEPGDTFQLVIGRREAHPTAYQWGTFQLAPHLAVDAAQEADLIVLYDRPPGGDYPSESFERPTAYATRYLLGKRRDAR